MPGKSINMPGASTAISGSNYKSYQGATEGVLGTILYLLNLFYALSLKDLKINIVEMNFSNMQHTPEF